METNKKLMYLVVGSILGIAYTIYSLYNNRGGYMTTNDWISTLFACLFVTGLFFYFKKKWKNEE